VPFIFNPRNVPDERVTRGDDVIRGKNDRSDMRKAMSGTRKRLFDDVVTWWPAGLASISPQSCIHRPA
jgi:hypothetical protein